MKFRLILAVAAVFLAGCGAGDPSGPVKDSVPPAEIHDLAPTDTTQTTVSLHWTAPGDDGRDGVAFQFELRFTTGDLSDGASWVSAFQVPDEPLPESSGTDQEYTVTGLFPETTYRFAVKTRDEVEENWSGLSNVVSVTTLPN